MSRPGGTRNANVIFPKLFSFSSPFGDDDDDDDDDGGTGFLQNDLFRSFRGGLDLRKAPPVELRKAPPIENRLPCSLEELYKGTTKKMKITRDVVDINGKAMQVEEILTVDVKPGCKKGRRITFRKKGNVQPNDIPADIIFIVDEKPHTVFTRDGNHLIVTQNISLGEALKGYTVRLTTLDGRTLNIPINNVIHPSYVRTVRREGMPIPNEPAKSGNLIIKFNIKFPTSLTDEQKAGIMFY